MKQISAMWLLLIAISTALFAPILASGQVNSYPYNIVQTGNAYPGYVLIAPTGSDTIGVVDNSGLFVFPVNVGMQTNLSSFNDRQLTYFSVSLGSGVFDLRCLVRVDAQFRVIDSIKPIGPYSADFHEGYATSDSTAMVLGTYTLDVDLSKIVSGGKADAKVVGAIIQEVTRSGRVLFEWKSFDHLSYLDATEDIDYTQPLIDVVHVNSIVRDTDGSLIISCRHLDEVIKISRSTGQILWRMGGSKSKNNQFRFVNDSLNGFAGFSHQHSAVRTSRGTLLMFDNGNLRPAPRYSRVVEYEVNEQTKTAKKVFEYSPSNPVYAVSMGSVYELPNQNLLIGYGSAATITGTDKDIAAQEIDRNGTVVATVYNIPTARYRPYRIVKSTFGMTGLQRTISVSGTTAFASSDSSTCLSLVTTQAKTPTVATVERHHYVPRNISDSIIGSAFFFPARWTIRLSDTSSLTGSTKLKLDRASRVDDPSSVRLVRRDIEGKGGFSAVNATFSAADSSWTIPFIKQGEYAVVYRTRISPELIHPGNRSQGVERNVTLRWHRLLYADTYDVQLANDSLFSSIDFTTSTTDTTWSPALLAPNTSYWWRIRKVRGTAKGAWSSPWRFRTEIDIPVVVEPDTTQPLNLVYRSSAFRWRSVQGASQYQLVVLDTNNDIALDTTTADTVLYPVTALAPNARYQWFIKSRIGSTSSRASRTYGIATGPSQPSLVRPEPNVFLAPSNDVSFMWRSGPSQMFRIRLYQLPDQTLLVDSTLQDTTFVVSGLTIGAKYSWSVNAIGTYGQSEPSTREFAIALAADLSAPIIDKSSPRSGLTPSMPSRYWWQTIAGASEYHIQTANAVVFDQPILDTVVTGADIQISLPMASALYAMRVQARSGFRTSLWSDTVYLTTIVDSSQAIVPTHPTHGAVDAGTSGVFRFFTNGVFNGYEVQVARDPQLTNIDFKYYCFSDSTGYDFLTSGTRYFWRVIGTSTNGPAFASQIATMIVSDEVSVSQGSGYEAPISFTRLSDVILLQNIGDARISHIRLYTILGQCLSSFEAPFESGDWVLPIDFNDPCFIVVTFLSGKTYLIRA